MMDRKHTLCWDCRKACGGCSWSSYPEYEPVAGWTAINTKIRMKSDLFTDSYIVIDCPEFERDGVCGGMKRNYDNAWTSAALRKAN